MLMLHTAAAANILKFDSAVIHPIASISIDYPWPYIRKQSFGYFQR